MFLLHKVISVLDTESTSLKSFSRSLIIMVFAKFNRIRLNFQSPALNNDDNTSFTAF